MNIDNLTDSVTNTFPILKKLENKIILYDKNKSVSLATSIVMSNISYKPGVYLIYEFDSKSNALNELLYVGKAGADSSGKISNQQLPSRLVATIKLKEEYHNHKNANKSKEMNRDKAFKIMMDIDNIETIIIFCFFTEISNEFKSNPLEVEKKINKMIKNRPLKWAKR